MICVNELGDQKCNKHNVLEPLLIPISPYAPHFAEELWNQFGHAESITLQPSQNATNPFWWKTVLPILFPLTVKCIST